MFLTGYFLMSALVLTGLYLFQRLVASLLWGGKEPQLYSKLETTGLSSYGPFPRARAIIRSVLATRENASDGYNKISKILKRPFTLPTTWIDDPLVVLPPAMLQHMMTRPDKTPESDITNIRGLIETIQLPYIINDPDIYLNALHFDVVRRKMHKKHMPFFAAITAEEIDLAFKDYWGTSKEWKTINGWDTCGRIIARTAERIMVGLPMGRNEDLLEVSRLYAESVLLGGAIMNCFPPFVRRLIGPIIALRAKYYQKKCTRLLIPIITERMNAREIAEVQQLEDENEPDDFLQWLIATCEKDGPHQMYPDRIANRLIALMTPLIFAVCYVFAHSVLDLYGNPAKDEFVAGLASECKRVSADHNGLKTTEAVDSLYRVDSAIRESMRTSDVSVYSLYRDVTAGKLDLGNGVAVPEGVRMVFPTQNIHLDPSNYKDSLRYDPFRFSRSFEETDEDSPKPDTLERKLIATPTPAFLALGYGRHACPGRWFAAQTMKQALAHIVLNYEVELIGKPIKRRALLNTMVPPVDAKIRVKRKT